MNRYGRGSSCGFTLELGAPADHPVALLIPLAPSDEHTKLGFCSGGAAMRPPAQVYQYDQQKREKPLRSCFQVFCSVFFYIRTLTIVRDTHSGSSFFFLFVCPVLHWNLRKTIRNFKWFKNKKSAKNVPYLMLKKKSQALYMWDMRNFCRNAFISWNSVHTLTCRVLGGEPIGIVIIIHFIIIMIIIIILNKLFY